MSQPRIVLVVAAGENGVIGRDGDLPWRLPSDLKRFKAATVGKPVVMGRKTWESLPVKPLPGRANMVVSRSLREAPGAQLFTTLEEALEEARVEAAAAGVAEICVIGGAQIYAAALPEADAVLLSEVALSPEGDVRFPALDPAQWSEVSAEPVEPGPEDDAAFTVRRFERVRR